jgi:hypothetical protein
MTLSKSQLAVVAERRERVATLYIQQRSMREIAAAVGCSVGTVCTDMKANHAAWLASRVDKEGQGAAIELARIDRLEREYWDAWERSCKDSEKRQARTVQGDKPRQEASKTEEGRDGNPRFLEGVQWCIRQRCELLGLLLTPGTGNTTSVLVVGGIDMAVATGARPDPGLTYERLHASANGHN